MDKQLSKFQPNTKSVEDKQSSSWNLEKANVEFKLIWRGKNGKACLDYDGFIHLREIN